MLFLVLSVTVFSVMFYNCQFYINICYAQTLIVHKNYSNIVIS